MRPPELLHSIHIAPGAAAAMQSLAEVYAHAGRGLEGDRYLMGTGTWSARPEWWNEITLIELETIEALARDHAIRIEPGAARRNLVTSGVALNHLVGVEFRFGEVRLRGLRLCEPCRHLDLRAHSGLRDALVHRGGLRAAILSDGWLRVGMSIERLQQGSAGT